MVENDQNPPRILTPNELGLLILFFRNSRKWSQETLAELSGLSVRTIQRIEKGEPASTETKQALALAFGCEDIDQFDKTTKVLTAEEIKKQQEDSDAKYLSLKAETVLTGRRLATLAAQMNANLFSCNVAIQGQAEIDLANIMDYLKEYGDSHELYSEVDKLSIYEELQILIDRLKNNNISLCCALRKGNFSSKNPKHIPISVLYMIAFEQGSEPESFNVERLLHFN